MPFLKGRPRRILCELASPCRALLSNHWRLMPSTWASSRARVSMPELRESHLE